MCVKLIALCVTVLVFVQSVHTAKILGIFAHTGISHYLVFEPVLKELARRGHKLTVFSYFENESTKNYSGIQFKKLFNTTSFVPMDSFENRYTTSAFVELQQLYRLTSVYENAVSSQKLQQITGENFDAVITEMFNSDVIYGLLNKINAPIIGFTSCDLLPWQNDAIGGTNNPAYVPLILSDYSINMNLYQRTLNAFYLVFANFVYWYKFQPEAQKLAEKYLGETPNLDALVANTSLLLTNTHYSVFGARPTLPAVIEIAGVHILPAKPLPKLIQEAVDQHEEVMYFSLGSAINSATMSKEKQLIFFKVFSKLKPLVLWKSSIEIPEKSNRIILSDWYPQRDILAEQKTILFISHCGLLGTLEAVQSGVPILCMPMFGDQHHNAKAVETKQIGIILQYSEVSEDSFTAAVHELLTNPKYRKNAKKLAKVFNDRPMSPMDTAIYWIEHVIRHGGAPDLKSGIRHLTWYQYYNLDVIAIYLGLFYLIFKFIKFIVVKLWKFVMKFCKDQTVKSYKIKSQ